ncbi:MAG: hypothetical protein ABEJ24_04930 [Candidatus Magasanikbacteria bacterium]
MSREVGGFKPNLEEYQGEEGKKMAESEGERMKQLIESGEAEDYEEAQKIVEMRDEVRDLEKLISNSDLTDFKEKFQGGKWEGIASAILKEELSGGQEVLKDINSLKEVVNDDVLKRTAILFALSSDPTFKKLLEEEADVKEEEMDSSALKVISESDIDVSKLKEMKERDYNSFDFYAKEAISQIENENLEEPQSEEGSHLNEEDIQTLEDLSEDLDDRDEKSEYLTHAFELLKADMEEDDYYTSEPQEVVENLATILAAIGEGKEEISQKLKDEQSSSILSYNPSKLVEEALRMADLEDTSKEYRKLYFRREGSDEIKGEEYQSRFEELEETEQEMLMERAQEEAELIEQDRESLSEIYDFLYENEDISLEELQSFLENNKIENPVLETAAMTELKRLFLVEVQNSENELEEVIDENKIYVNENEYMRVPGEGLKENPSYGSVDLSKTALNIDLDDLPKELSISDVENINLPYKISQVVRNIRNNLSEHLSRGRNLKETDSEEEAREKLSSFGDLPEKLEQEDGHITDNFRKLTKAAYTTAKLEQRR